MSVLRRTFATRSSACVGPVDQHVASRRPVPLPALRMARTLGETGMKRIDRPDAPMQVKDATAKHAVITASAPRVTANPQASHLPQAVGLCMQTRRAGPAPQSDLPLLVGAASPEWR